MRSTLLTLFCVLSLFSFSSQAQQTDVPFDDSIPSNWHASGSSTLSLNTEHLKVGTHALKWAAAGGDTLLAGSLRIPASLISSSSHFFIYSPSAGTDTLIVQFLDSTNTIKREGHMLLNFRGWREYHRNLQDDYNYGNSLPAFFCNAFRLIYRPAVTGTSKNIWIDQVQFVGYGQARTPGPHMALDHQHFALNPEDGPAGNSLESWLNTSDIPDTAASDADLTGLAAVRLAFHRDTPTVDGTQLIAAKAYVDGCGITRNADNSITGRPITAITVYFPDTILLLSKYCSILARASLLNHDTVAKAKLLLFVEYLLDQGLAEGGRIVMMTNEYKTTDSIPKGFLQTLPALPLGLRQSVIEMLKFSNEYNKIFASSVTPGLNLDFLYLKAPYLYELACAEKIDNRAVRDLKSLRRWMEQNTLPGQGGRDGIKPDFTAFHHQAHQITYLHAYNAWISCAYNCINTPFRMTSTAFANYSKAIKALMLETSKGLVFPNADCGRTPFQSSIPVDSASFGRLVRIGGDIAGSGADPDLASLYNYIYGTSAYGASAADLDGYYAYNYAQMGVFRKNGWTAAMRGFTDRLFGTEIYPTENRYGRYQSYGALEVLYSGTLTGTGYTKDGAGWEWNFVPGATTVQLPFTSLQPAQSKLEEHQQNSFAGAMPMGRDGIFAMDFQQDATGINYPVSNLRFHKSVFAFDSLLICLGSGIGAANNYGPVITTLFQSTASAALFMDTTVQVANPTTGAYKVDSPGHWLYNNQKTGFYLPGGNDSLKIFRGSQTTPDESDTNNTVFQTASAARAWITHGSAPTAARYQFVVVPQTTTQKMKEMAPLFARRLIYSVLSQTDTLHAVRYLASHTNAYVFFQPKYNVNIGFIRSVSAKALIGARENGDTLTLTIANPDLNAINNDTSYWRSTSSTIDLTIKGVWSTLNNSSGALVSQSGDSLTAEFTLADGKPVTLVLLRSGADPSQPGVWTNQFPVDSSWIYNIDTGYMHKDSITTVWGTGKTSISPGTGSANGFLANPPTGTVKVSLGSTGTPRFDITSSPRSLKMSAADTTNIGRFSAYGLSHARPIASAIFTMSFNNDPATDTVDWTLAFGKNGSSFFSGSSGLPRGGASNSVPDVFGALKWTIAPSNPAVIRFRVRQRDTSTITNNAYELADTASFQRGGSYNMEVYANATVNLQTYTRGITTYTVQPRSYHVWANNSQLSFKNNNNFPANEMPTDSAIAAFAFDSKGNVNGPVVTKNNSSKITIGHTIRINFAAPALPGSTAALAKLLTISPAIIDNGIGVSVRAAPNPAADQLQLIYTATKAGKTNISIVSMSGQVSLRREVWLIRGMNYIPFNIGRLPSGIYTIVVAGPNGRQTLKIAH